MHPRYRGRRVAGRQVCLEGQGDIVLERLLRRWTFSRTHTADGDCRHEIKQRRYCAFPFCFVFTRRQRRYIYSSFLPFLLILEIALLICSLWGTTFPPLSPCYLREANPISGVQDSQAYPVRAQYLTGIGDWCREWLCPICTSEIQAQELWCTSRKERCFFFFWICKTSWTGA